MKQRKQILRKKTFERDNLTCQKCKIQDKTGKILEAHHIVPLCFNGEDDADNLITLCNDCHHFAPNKKEEFEEYMKSECNGTLTTLIKAWQKVSQEQNLPLQDNKVQEKVSRGD